MKKRANYLLALPLLTCLQGAVVAEVTTDGTVGAATALAGPNFDIAATLGQQQGGNLFHSFSAFNIADTESANFSGPAGINNIVSRVTGGSASNIDGAINSSIAGANLFMINPGGIIFGPNASLNVSGSFHASTAGYLVMADGGRFDAVTPGNSILTSAPPSAFGFLGNPAGINVQGSFLEVPNGEELSLMGGDLTITDGIIFAPAGTVNIVSVASSGELVLSDPDFGANQFSQMGDINLQHTGDLFSRIVGFQVFANLDTTSTSGGKIVIRGGNFVLDNGAVFSDSVGQGPAGSVDIAVRDELRLTNESVIDVGALGDGGAGVITAQARDINVQSGATIQLTNFGAGSGGNMALNASDTINIGGTSTTTPPLIGNKNSIVLAVTFRDGPAGDIQVNAPVVNINAGGEIILDGGSGAGSGGTLDMTAGALVMRDGGVIQAKTGGTGNAGNLYLALQSADLGDGAVISTVSRGDGAAGKINIIADDSVSIAGSDSNGPSGIFSNAFSSGDGGQVSLTTDRLSLEDGAAIQAGVGSDPDPGSPVLPPATAATRAGSIILQASTLDISGDGLIPTQISTQSENAGQAGNITIGVTGALSIDSAAGDMQSGVFSTASGAGAGGDITVNGGALVMNGGAINVSSNTAGDAGSITASLDSVSLQSGAQISTSVAGSGQGGALTVSAVADVSLDGQASDGFSSGLYSQTSGSGTGGAVAISAANVSLTDHATINSESLGTGDAGDINVTAVNTVELDNAAITTAAASADGGNIKVTASELVYLVSSDITAAVGGGLGNGGNVDIDPQFVVLSGSNILASAIGGNGGNITVVADHFISSPGSVLNASSQLGIDGTISILSPDEEVSSNQVELPVAYLDAAGLLRERCSARRLGDRSSFVVAGRNSLPVAPDSPYALLSGIPGSIAGTAAGSLRNPALLSANLAAGIYGCSL